MLVRFGEAESHWKRDALASLALPRLTAGWACPWSSLIAASRAAHWAGSVVLARRARRAASWSDVVFMGSVAPCVGLYRLPFFTGDPGLPEDAGKQINPNVAPMGVRDRHHCSIEAWGRGVLAVFNHEDHEAHEGRTASCCGLYCPSTAVKTLARCRPS